MQKTTFRAVGQELRAAFHSSLRMALPLLRNITALPLPALLLTCLGMALILTLLPLALLLFIGFLALRLLGLFGTPAATPVGHLVAETPPR